MLADSARRVRSRLSDLIANDRVFRTFQRGLKVGFDVRQRLDRNILRLFSVLNFPARSDVAYVDEQVSLLEEDLARIAGRLAELRTRVEQRQSPPASHASKE